MPSFGSFMSMNLLSSMVLPKAIERNETAKALHLIQSGANPNAPGDEDWPLFLRGTPLENHNAFRRVRPVICLAISKGNIAVVEKLLAYGADLWTTAATATTTTTNANTTVAMMATRKEERDAATMTLSMMRGASVTAAHNAHAHAVTTTHDERHRGLLAKISDLGSRVTRGDFLVAVLSMKETKVFFILLLFLLQFRLAYIHRYVLPSALSFVVLMLPFEGYGWRMVSGRPLRAPYLQVERSILVCACVLFGLSHLLAGNVSVSDGHGGNPNKEVTDMVLSLLGTILYSVSMKGYVLRRCILFLLVVWQSMVHIVRSVKAPPPGVQAILALMRYDQDALLQRGYPTSSSPSSSLSVPLSPPPLATLSHPSPPTTSLSSSTNQLKPAPVQTLALTLLPKLDLGDPNELQGLYHAVLQWSVSRNHEAIVMHLIERGIGPGLVKVPYIHKGRWGYFEAVVSGYGEVLAALEGMDEGIGQVKVEDGVQTFIGSGLASSTSTISSPPFPSALPPPQTPRSAPLCYSASLAPLTLASAHGHSSIVKLLLEHCACDFTRGDLDEALVWCCSRVQFGASSTEQSGLGDLERLRETRDTISSLLVERGANLGLVPVGYASYEC